MWASQVNKLGRSVRHWRSLTEVRQGDVAINYTRGAVRAISTVVRAATEAPRPVDPPELETLKAGWLVPIRVVDLAEPISLEDIPLAMREGRAQAPFDVRGAVRQGYLFPLSVEWFAKFARLFADRLPAYVRTFAWPAELAVGAEASLRSLAGEQLHTLTGRPNMITEVGDGVAIVATERSSGGQAVPIADVQAALDQLRHDGRVICQPGHVGYRSAFIGAVLRTLPGTVVTLEPPCVSFAAAVAPGDVVGLNTGVRFPAGALDAATIGSIRREQPALRRALLGNRSHAPCALCGHELTAELLVAAHIKQRSLCTDDEKRDLTNIGMLACKLGCDDLYELGYISVDTNGSIITTALDNTQHGEHVAAQLIRLAGTPCVAFTIASASYFEWHRRTRFRGGAQRSVV